MIQKADVMFVADGDSTLAEAWEELAASLQSTGAQGYQISAMKMTFFMGAAQTYMSIDAHSRGGRDEFTAVMEGMSRDIDAALKIARSPRRGHA